MLTATITVLAKDYPAGSESLPKLLDVLGGVADICTSLLLNHKHANEDVNKMCLRCIVGATLMIDHLAPTGAFGIKPRFHVKEGMDLLVGYQPRPSGLINAIKFTSKHLKDEGSDPKIKALFQ
jgi:hypothetical protein